MNKLLDRSTPFVEFPMVRNPMEIMNSVRDDIIFKLVKNESKRMLLWKRKLALNDPGQIYDEVAEIEQSSANQPPVTSFEPAKRERLKVFERRMYNANEIIEMATRPVHKVSLEVDIQALKQRNRRYK